MSIVIKNKSNNCLYICTSRFSFYSLGRITFHTLENIECIMNTHTHIVILVRAEILQFDGGALCSQFLRYCAITKEKNRKKF